MFAVGGGSLPGLIRGTMAVGGRCHSEVGGDGSDLMLLVGHVGFGMAASMAAGHVWLLIASTVSVVVMAVGDAREIGGASHHCFSVCLTLTAGAGAEG